jgi:hypothetical protein
MKMGRIDSICLQYSRNALEHHLPCMATILREVPNKNRCMVLLILKLCPGILGKPAAIQILLDLIRKYFLRRVCNEPLLLIYENKRADSGIRVLAWR